ncbi:hypothetical protein EYF80_051956 [Liparis tanakae]|uniref:Uncharacterized protein n=1 Tax=Liparis tanakae TaxID=230148 RepID=A0A4Z2FAS6_9TELE|nr:hypothetical protein EYF80_051956 [Liparis tanakae]
MYLSSTHAELQASPAAEPRDGAVNFLSLNTSFRGFSWRCTYHEARSAQAAARHAVAVRPVGADARLAAALAVETRRARLVAVEPRPPRRAGALPRQRVAAGRKEEESGHRKELRALPRVAAVLHLRVLPALQGQCRSQAGPYRPAGQYRSRQLGPWKPSTHRQAPFTW